MAIVPFDHERRVVSVLVDGPDGRQLIAKGAPEAIVDRCRNVPTEAKELLEEQFKNGSRVVAVATRHAADLATLHPGDEHDLTLVGLLIFLDQPKTSAKAALERLARLGITVKIVTGDNAAVAEHVCRELELPVAGTLTGAEIESLDDDTLVGRLASTTIFARVSPEQKSRIVSLHHSPRPSPCCLWSSATSRCNAACCAASKHAPTRCTQLIHQLAGRRRPSAQRHDTPRNTRHRLRGDRLLRAALRLRRRVKALHGGFTDGQLWLTLAAEAAVPFIGPPSTS